MLTNTSRLYLNKGKIQIETFEYSKHSRNIQCNNYTKCLAIRLVNKLTTLIIFMCNKLAKSIYLYLESSSGDMKLEKETHFRNIEHESKHTKN